MRVRRRAVRVDRGNIVRFVFWLFLLGYTYFAVGGRLAFPRASISIQEGRAVGWHILVFRLHVQCNTSSSKREK
jgi:hypothetical protein